MNWWQRFLKRSQLDTELDAELRFHFQAQVEKHIGEGLSESEAHRRARIEFGGLDQVKEDCRDARGIRWLEDLGQDLRFAMRLLTKHRSFTLIAVVVLALGIGVNGMFFTLVEMICLRGLPFHQVDRIMYLATRDARERARGLSFHDFADVRAAARTFAGIGAFTGAPMTLGDQERAPDRFTGAYVSANTFKLLREAPVVGRDFLPQDDQPGATAVVIIGNRVWRDRYVGDPSIIGRTIQVNGVPSTVIGVMPNGFKFPNNTNVWQPLAMMPQLADQKRDARTLAVLGRLVDSVPLLDARAEVDSIAARLARDYPLTNTGIRTTIVPINERYNGNITDPVWLAFISAGGLVLLIACANVANLLLMRSTERSREIAIRASLGATRRRVVRQLLAESTLLALLGGIFGLGLSLGGLHLVSSLVPQETLPYWMDFTMDRRVFRFLAAICLGTSCIFGLMPALHLSKTDVNGVLKDGARGGGGLPARRWTAAFLASQVALTLLLLVQLTFGVRGVIAEQRKDPTIDMSRLLTMSVALPNQKYRTPEDRVAFYERLEERIRGLDAISSAAIASSLPFGGASARQLMIDGIAPTGTPSPTVWTVSIGERYFETMGLPLSRGRALDERDGIAGHENVIVNQRFVEMYFPNEDAIGKRIQLRSEGSADSAPWLIIIGISPTVRQRTLLEPDPIAYLPYRAEPPAIAALIARGRSEPMSIAPMLREQVRALDPDLPLYRMMTMERAVSESRWNGRVSNLLLTILTCIAVGLAAVGLYTVTSHSVTQRTQEIGIRMAIGAQPWQLGWLVLRRAMLQLGVGLILGVVCTLVWEKLFASYSGPSTPSDPLNLMAGAAVLVLVGIIACLWPARRATHLEPVVALRYE